MVQNMNRAAQLKKKLNKITLFYYTINMQIVLVQLCLFIIFLLVFL